MPDANAILTQWEAVCEAASKPWRHIEDAPMFVGVTEMVETPHDNINFGRTNFGTNLQPRFDARFAAAARTSWPATIRALKVAREKLRHVEQVVGYSVGADEIDRILEGRDA